jgi:predicted HicB family RNase H-like nuclease
MTEPIARTKQIGRPRSREPNNTVCSWVPARVHDRLIRIANAREMSVSEYVRRVIIFALKDDSSGEIGG